MEEAGGSRVKHVSEKFEGTTLLALRMEGRVMRHGLPVISQSWKREEDKFSPEPPEGAQPPDTLVCRLPEL